MTARHHASLAAFWITQPLLAAGLFLLALVQALAGVVLLPALFLGPEERDPLRRPEGQLERARRAEEVRAARETGRAAPPELGPTGDPAPRPGPGRDPATPAYPLAA
jgi:hypothetical protein